MWPVNDVWRDLLWLVLGMGSGFSFLAPTRLDTIDQPPPAGWTSPADLQEAVSGPRRPPPLEPAAAEFSPRFATEPPDERD